ncbi:MAG: hypothetical protein ABSC22_15585 [Roseiarcus sp.]|jgi:hypothetical protein
MLTIAPAPSPLNLAAALAGLAIAAASPSPLQAEGAAGVASVAAGTGVASVAASAAGVAVSALSDAAALALTLQAVSLAPIAGAVAIDVAKGNTFVVAMNASAAISFLNWPPAGRSQRVAVYFVQDAIGGRVASWPAVKWPDGQAPALSIEPGAIDCVVFDSFDGGANVFGNLVGEGYV